MTLYLARRSLLVAAWSGWALRRSDAAGAGAAIPSGAQPAAPPLAGVRAIGQFGPVGTTDDTATFNRWLQSGEPARLDGVTYHVPGQLHDAAAATVRGFGVPGRTVIRRPTGLKAVTWVTLRAPELWLHGITWDMNGQTGADAWGVVIAPTTRRIRLEQCAFLNNQGGRLACGAVIYGRDKASDRNQIEIVDCTASGNGFHGIWLASVADTVVARGEYHHNGGFGLRVSPFGVDPAKSATAERVTISGTRAHHNGNAGIAVGSSDRGTNARHIFDLAGAFNAIDITIRDVVTSDNGGYGVGLTARRSIVRDCVSARDGGNTPGSGLAGFGAAGVGSRLVNCRVSGHQTFGFDAGGLFEGAIENCSSDGPSTAFNLGSFRNLTCRGLKAANFKKLLNCGRVELAGDKFGNQFNVAASGLLIEDITGDITGSTAPGQPQQPIIFMLDNPENIRIKQLNVVDPAHRATAATPFAWAVSSSFWVDSYRYNGSERVTLTARQGLLVVPDQVSSAEIAGRPVIDDIRFWTQMRIADGIAWWTIVTPAAGLTVQPRLEIAAAARPGARLAAAASPVVETYDGTLTGLMFGSGKGHGSGYARAAARILPANGIGTPGVAVAQIGVPLRRGVRLALALPDGGVVLGHTVARGGTIRLVEKSGAWAVAG